MQLGEGWQAFRIVMQLLAGLLRDLRPRRRAAIQAGGLRCVVQVPDERQRRSRQRETSRSSLTANRRWCATPISMKQYHSRYALPIGHILHSTIIDGRMPTTTRSSTRWRRCSPRRRSWTCGTRRWRSGSRTCPRSRMCNGTRRAPSIRSIGRVPECGQSIYHAGVVAPWRDRALRQHHKARLGGAGHAARAIHPYMARAVTTGTRRSAA